ncbi:DUF3560 domain-containing protein [Actinoplanes sp. NPDC026623]|uniref:DUF3560 domain-containing protein n=1 Tax=Actinoplanes sp. NPDC026623 TaxID=3155610 RepID=UPI0034098732
MAHLTITHTHQDGTRLTGSQKKDGVYEIVRRNGFTWRCRQGIHIRPSRDLDAKTLIINRAARALRDAGHEVTIEIDNTPRPTEIVEAERQERAEDRAKRFAERAGNADAAGLEAARSITDGIPFGQPILVDHYSAGRHRRDLSRADNHRGKALELWNKGEHLADRARGAVAHQKHRENPRTTMRRIEKLEADTRRYQRELGGYERNFRNGNGDIAFVETHEPAISRRRDDLQRWIADADEQITYWRTQLAAHEESGAFVPWARQHFVKGDQVRHHGFGDWYEVTRVNTKSVSVTGSSWGWPRTIAWDKVAGRRRDGMQWDTPNGEPWPVELAGKIARWRSLERDLAGNDSSTEALFKRGRIELARNIALGLDMHASDAEAAACLEGVTDAATDRKVKAAFVDVYDRLAAGETAAEVTASYEPIELAAAWRMPDREPVRRTAVKSFFIRDRDDIIAVQPGDLIVGFYDRGYGKDHLMRGFCGPVAAVSEVNDRRESGEFVSITLTGGQERTFKLPLWFAVHPAGTWDKETPPAAASAVDVAEVSKAEPVETVSVTASTDPEPQPSAADNPVEHWTAIGGANDDDCGDPWGPLLAELRMLADQPG